MCAIVYTRGKQGVRKCELNMSQLLDKTNKASVEAQLQKVEQLRGVYESVMYDDDTPASYELLCFQDWFKLAVQLFYAIVGENDDTFRSFKSADVSGNIYELHHVYSAVQADYVILCEKVKTYIQYGDTSQTDNEGSIRQKKIFISHSSKDKKFAEALIIMLNSLGFREGEIFCSSIQGYWIKKGNFFKVIMEQFEHNDLYVIFIQSPRFYASPISLNEMGAAWALHSEYYSFLTKDMEYDHMSAVVNNHEIACKVNEKDAKGRLNDWQEEITKYFGKEPINWSVWEDSRDAFLKKVRRLAYKKVQADKENVSKSDKLPKLSKEDEELLRKWVNSDNSEMYKLDYLGGGSIVLGNDDYAYSPGREEAKWNAFLKRLLALDFIEPTGRAGNSARYLLTEKAYNYFE